ncbi:hypothetical protein [Streptosporangium sp. CA-115845]|uniref:hypothetical protein n=1 Tax=Streptosporangium sp. CA-115845 TaxID=3240071 RepID=UPI003D900DF0
MSHIDEIITARLGEAPPGPIQQDGAARRAAINFGYLADRPDRRTVWLETRAELLALYNAAGHQLTRWDALDRQLAEDAHPSQPNPAPALGPASHPLKSSAPAPTAPPLAPVPAPAPVRGPFESAHPQPLQPLPLPSAVASAAPVPPSAVAMAEALADTDPRRGVRPYVLPTPAQPAGEAVVPDPHGRPGQQ